MQGFNTQGQRVPYLNIHAPNMQGMQPTQTPMPAAVEAEQPQAAPAKQMTKRRIEEAQATLQKYKAGKSSLERRLVENDKWWRLQHWDVMDSQPNATPQRSAWLLNSLLNKHADAMDNYPSANVLPREKSDQGTAKALSSVLPTVLEQNEFESVYSDAWWQKLQAGTAVYGVFWNNRKMNGLGDVEIRQIDMLNLFWEPGVKDIQSSRNIFHVEEQPNETLKGQYPALDGKLGGQGFSLTEYGHDDSIDHSQKSLVVDWYYKTFTNGKTVLHFCKFCNGEILYSSEDDPKCATVGFYAHGKFPFVFDVLFPIKDSPAGFGYIDVMRDSQERIDKLGSAITQNAQMRAKKRFFIRTSGAVNEKEYANFTNDFVHADIDLGDTSSHIREIVTEPLGGDVITAYTAMINEQKETSGNRDFSQGGATGGVTAASAIAALQEAGSKLSRDMIKGGYRAYTTVCNITLELIRQFYDMPRTFRITGQQGMQFIMFDSTSMQEQEMASEFGNPVTARVPVFDISIKAQRTNPFSREAQNQLALQLLQMGFFSPTMADQSMAASKMMQFEGKEDLEQDLGKLAMIPQMTQIMMQLFPLVAQIAPDIAQQMVPILQRVAGGSGGQAAGGVAQEQPQTNSLGKIQQADDIAGRVKEKAAARSDPNGGTA